MVEGAGLENQCRRCALRSDRRSHSPRLPRVSFKLHFGALMIHAVCAESETPDWRSPPSVGSGPFAIAGPCARVPGRYAEPRNVKNLVAHPWSWAIGSSTSAAQMSFDMVVCRRKARPFGNGYGLGRSSVGTFRVLPERCGNRREIELLTVDARFGPS